MLDLGTYKGVSVVTLAGFPEGKWELIAGGTRMSGRMIVIVRAYKRLESRKG